MSRRIVAAVAAVTVAGAAAAAVLTLPPGHGPATTVAAGTATAPGRAAVPVADPAPPSPADAGRWQPATGTGLTGPAADVLTTAPAAGPVRIVTLAQDPAGHPKVVVTIAADRAHAAAAVTTARAVPGALAVAVDHRVRLATVEKPTPVHAAGTGTTTPVPARTSVAATATPANDTYRNQQWALDTLQAENAWALHNGSGATVAVVDTGVDGTHPDLAARLLPGIDELASNPDGRTDPNGHGTHVAGIIGAIANNNVGVAGLADGVSILPVRVLGADGSGWDSDVANGVIWAADHGAGVINMSLSGPDDDPTLDSAISYAQSKNVVVVVAAGNDRQNGNPVDYPAADPGVVAVAATDSTNASASFSETGSFVTIAAPGVDIASTYPVSQGSYVYMSGTSMASPYVAASAALVRAAAPNLSATAVAADLTKTALDLGAAGRDDEFGAGLVQPVAALQAVLAQAPTTTTLTLSATQVNPGTAVTVTTTVKTSAGAAADGKVLFCVQPNGQSANCGAQVPLVNGSASKTFTPSITTGVWIEYLGSATTARSVGAWQVVHVAAATTTTLTLSATQVSPGAAVTATATVKNADGSAAPGSVLFCVQPNGSAANCGSEVPLTGGTATKTLTPSVTTGLWIQYVGTPDEGRSIGAWQTITVATGTPAATTTTLTLSATQVNPGTAVTVTASVKTSAGAASPGTVLFCIQPNGASADCGAQVPLVNGAASKTFTPSITTGVWIEYLGSATTARSVGAWQVVHVTAPTTTTLTLSATQVAAGAPVTISTTVKNADGSAAPGSVLFCTQPTGQSANCGAQVPLVNGAASKTLTPSVTTGVWIQYVGTPDEARSIGAWQTITVK